MRKGYLLPLFLSASLLAHSQQNPLPDSPGPFHSDYQPPVFTDGDRNKKIAAAFPAVEKIYRDYALKNHFPGLAFGIVVDGQLVYSGSMGYTDLSQHQPVNSLSLFRIASMTKSFTALAILKLRDDGKLSLEDPVYQYIPEIKKMIALTADAPPITIRHLLSHSAGFPEDNPWGDRQLADTDDELIQLIEKGISFSNVPGISYEYSNLGFAMLGMIITKVSGKPYQQYITENILGPLGMRHTLWEYTQAPKNLLAHGYRWLNEKWNEEPLLHDGAYGAMGGLITSIEDFSLYMAYHLSAWPPRNEANKGPVKRSSLREMHQPHTFSSHNLSFKYPNGRICPTINFYNYGLRWTRDCEGRIYTGHTGGLPGFGSQWWIMPDYGIGVVAMANLTYASLSTPNWAALDTIISIADLHPRQLPASGILTKRKQELLALLPDWNEARQSGIFAVNFFSDNPLDSLKNTSRDLFAKAGKIRRITELIPENQLRGQFVIEGEKGNIRVSFTLTPENPALIQQLTIALL